MKHLKVIGIGDNVADKYISEGVMYPGGNALNFCAYATMNGMKAAYLGKFGNDAVAAYNQKVIKELGIDASHCRIFDGENGFARVNLVNGDRVFIDSNKGGIAKVMPYSFNEDDLEYIRSFALIHTSLNSYIEEDLPFLKSSQVPISYDFSVRWNDAYLQKVCPFIDIAILSCSHLDEVNRINEMKKAQSLGARIVLGTVGEDGSYALFKDQMLYQQAVKCNQIIDTMGAGDAYLTAFLTTMIKTSESGSIFCEQDRKMMERMKVSMKAGAEFAANICQVNGAFGFGTLIV